MKIEDIKFKAKRLDNSEWVGSLREAIATLKLNFEYVHKSNRKPCFSTVCYFDLEKQAFRSFSIATFLGVEEVLN